MRKFYHTAFTILFFALIFIASCITFNNQKNIINYDYNRELLISNASFWGRPILQEMDDKHNNPNALLALFKDTRLQYIVSNDYNHYYRYKYIKINDTINVLVSQKNKTPLFARSDSYETIDSILFTPSLCYRKSISPRFTDRPIFHDFYIKDNSSIYEWKYEHLDKNNTFINLGFVSLVDILLYFKPENYSRIKDNLTLVKTYPIYVTNTGNSVDSFFRNTIMFYHYNHKKRNF